MSGRWTVRFSAIALAVAVMVLGQLAIVAPTPAAAAVAGSPPTLPGAPTGVSAVAGVEGAAVDGVGAATVEWTPPVDDGGSPITGYVVTPYVSSVAGTPVLFDATATERIVRDLTPGTAYTFTVAATNAQGVGAESAASAEVTPVSAPGAPTAVSALAGSPGSGEVTLSWTAPADDGGAPIYTYVIRRYIAGAPDGGWTSYGDAATEQTIVGLTIGTTYTFTVKALTLASGICVSCGGPESGQSNEVTPAATVPGAPTISPFVKAGNTQVTLNWADPAEDGGSPITGYVVTPYVGGVAGTPQVFADGPTVTVTGLTNGTTYTFTVAATNVVGTGPESAPSRELTPLTQPPDAPTGVSAEAGDGEATVSWTAPVDDGGSPVTGYLVTPFRDGLEQPGVTFASTDLSQTLTGLFNGFSYTFRVSAINAVGTGPRSASSAPAVPLGAPGAPVGVDTLSGNSEVTVSWVEPAVAGLAAVTGYLVIPYVGGVAGTPVVFDASATERTITGLSNGTTYTFTVAATNAFGTGPESAASPEVTPSTVPDAPSGVSAVAGNGAATVSWAAPADDGGSAVTGYVVTPHVSGVAQTPLMFNPTRLSRTVTGLSNGTTYTFTVAAINAAGTSAASEPSAAVTPAPTVPGVPPGVSVLAGNGEALVQWAAPPDDGGSPITGYVVTPYVGVVAGTPVVFDASATERTITGLSNGTTYTFTVAAINAQGTGAESDASAAVTPSTVPGAPTGASAVAGEGEATVSWTAPADDGGSAVTGYVVTPYVGVVAGTPVSFDASATERTITGLSNGTSYTFTVAATNARGTGAESDASAAVTPASPPGAPTEVRAVGGIEEATVSWTAPADDGGSPVTGYVVTPYGGVVAGTPVLFDASATERTVTGLTAGTTYRFTVRAVNAAGEGVESALNLSGPVLVGGLPDAPTGLSVIAGNGEVAVSWTAPASDGGLPVSGYRITPFIAGVAQTPVDVSSQSTTRVIDGLTNFTEYTFTVAATNDFGAGPASDPSAPVTPVPVPTAAPTVDSIVSASGELTVSWTAPGTDGGSPLTGYVVTTTPPGGDPIPHVFESTATTQNITGLVPGTTYEVRVAAVNVYGTGPAAFGGFGTVYLPPDAPTGVTATAEAGVMTVSWTPSVSDGGSPIFYYLVTAFELGDQVESAFVTPPGTTVDFESLAVGSTYTFTVTAVTSKGSTESASSDPVELTASAPGAPTDVVATGGLGQAVVTWTAPVDDGGDPITGYEVTPYLGGAAQPMVSVGDGEGAVVTGLTPGATYTFEVAAVNSTGTSVPSAASAEVSLAAAPACPGFPWTAATAPSLDEAIYCFNQVSAAGDYEIDISADLTLSAYPTVVANASVGVGLTVDGGAFTIDVPSGVGFDVSQGDVSLSDVTITGTVSNGGSLTVSSSTISGSDASGIVNSGDLVISASTVSGNAGTGITNSGTLSVDSSTVSGNGSTGIASFGTLSVDSSTVSGNGSAGDVGGGVFAFGAPATVSNSTISGNTADYGGGLLVYEAPVSIAFSTITDNTASEGAGIGTLVFSGGTPVGVAASVIEGNDGSDVDGVFGTPSGISSGGFNVVGVGNAASSFSATGDTTGVDAVLLALADNGGPTMTHALAGPSPARDLVTATVTGDVAVDQRGVARPDGPHKDAGAYEGPAPVPDVPGPPTAVSALASNGGATVSWTAPASDGGSPVTGYVVTPSVGGVPGAPVAFDASVMERTITGLTNGTAYTFTVAATNAVGTGVQSDPSDAVTPFVRVPADFDGDRVTDIGVFRPSSGGWFVDGQGVTYLGLDGDVPVPADYTGSGQGDRAVWRPSTGAWFVDGIAEPTYHGVPGDVAVPGDYDGDGTTDFAVWRPSDGGWYVDGQGVTYLGLDGDVPVPGDYDGDGTTDFAVFRPATGAWYVAGEPAQFFGVSGDVPLPGDYDGDGADELAVFRPSQGAWYVDGEGTTYFGLDGDVPVPGQYDAGPETDLAVFRPSTGAWFVEGAPGPTYFGLDGDVPASRNPALD